MTDLVSKPLLAEAEAPVGLKRERMVNFTLSDEGQDASEFGRVAREDFFNDGGSSTS
ncbi:hypothetical protein Pres01_27480 [Metapseudomonas resinovorans]|uniref:hypothetical protein n=1 Tax=Metapseudomonas resinovorans TaxID=53412 RepID=UPI00131C0FAF|nr:hypothetical protein [Pseudomonas resinovorans]GLZ86697.1 hypothetical protein Pres01_27480 [Pseudomonas resinovorans]